MIHLQCHFGLDILILAWEGAVATGLDFSPAAIAEARRLAAEIGVAADFVCTDVYDAPQVVDGEFNIVFTTGVRSAWLPDIVHRRDDRFAACTRRRLLFRRCTSGNAVPQRT